MANLIYFVQDIKIFPIMDYSTSYKIIYNCLGTYLCNIEKMHKPQKHVFELKQFTFRGY